MLDTMIKLFALIFTAAVAENTIFGRALVTRKMLFPTGREDVFIFSGLITTLVIATGVLCYFVDVLFLYPEGYSVTVRALCYIVLLAVVHTLLVLEVAKQSGPEFQQIKNVMVMAGYNAAVLGTILICSINRYALAERIAYFIGTGVGVTMSLVLIQVGSDNIAMSRVPRAFRGLPISLIYIGILSLAIYGLVGHQLAF